MTNSKPILAIIGGTGAEGSGLAKRWAAAGYPVIIGSRSAERAQEAAEALNNSLRGREDHEPVRGTVNEKAAAAGGIVVLTVPYSGHADTLRALKTELQGKILVDCTVPLQPPKVTRVSLPAAGSAAMEAQTILGEDVRVVSAFQNVSATLLDDLDADPRCDVLVTGNDPTDRERIIELARAAGMVGLHAGRLENAAGAEALTSILIFMNKHYKTHGAGIRITNLPQDVYEGG